MTAKKQAAPVQAGPVSTEIPKYQVTEKCYLNEMVLDPEDPKLRRRIEEIDAGETEFRPLIVAYEGRPAHYMVPMNDAARAMVKKFPPRGTDPLDALTIVAPHGAKIDEVLAKSV